MGQSLALLSPDQSLLVGFSCDLDGSLPLAKSLEWTLTLTFWGWLPDTCSQFSPVLTDMSVGPLLPTALALLC